MNASPVLGSSQNLISTQAGRLLSFNLATKQIGWSVTGASFSGQLALADGVIYALNGTSIDARRESDGGLLWSASNPASTMSPLLVTRNLLLGSTQTTTWAIDLATHRLAWSYPAGGLLALTQDGLLTIAGFDGMLTAIAVK
jgi:outer membrane protein assembly factor BamB